MAKIIPINPEIGDYVWFNREGRSYIPGPYEYIGKGKYKNIHTKEIIDPLGTPCLVEAETAYFGATPTEMSEWRRKKDTIEIVVEEG